jgi:Zn-dependent protease
MELIMNGFSTIWQGLDWSYLLKILESVVPALVCIIIHEICHGLAALALGDKTAKSQGRLSLNPLKHIDIFGLIMLAVFHIGWAKPVSVDMRNFKNPKRGMAITALAGPVSNFVLAALLLFVFGLIYKLLNAGSIGSVVLDLIYLTAYLSISLGLFNLIPFPPLDGSKVLFSLLPDRIYMKLMYFERYGMIILIVLVFGLSQLGINPISSASQAVFNVFFKIAEWSYKLVNA